MHSNTLWAGMRQHSFTHELRVVRIACTIRAKNQASQNPRVDLEVAHEVPSLAKKLGEVMAAGGGRVSFLQGGSRWYPAHVYPGSTKRTQWVKKQST